MDYRKNITKEQFNSLKGKELSWELIQAAIFAARGQNLERKRAVYEQLTPGQKILFGFTVLSGHTQYGWLQFFETGYGNYLPMIRWGLVQLQAQALIDNLDAAEKLYRQLNDIPQNKLKTPGEGRQPKEGQEVSAESEQEFAEVDRILMPSMQDAGQKMEAYIRGTAFEFVKFSD